MSHVPELDTNSTQFARRLAGNLRVARERRNLSTRQLAALSDCGYSAATLDALEAARLPLAGVDLAPLASLYRLDLNAILQPRTPVIVRPEGSLAAGGVSVGFDPGDSDSLLVAYLQLVRAFRNQRREQVVTLRRDDVESLASYLQVDGALVLERLGNLMGFTRAQRRTLTVLFAAGAAVLMAATTAFAAVPQVHTFGSGGLPAQSPTPIVRANEGSVDDSLLAILQGGGGGPTGSSGPANAGDVLLVVSDEPVDEAPPADSGTSDTPAEPGAGEPPVDSGTPPVAPGDDGPEAPATPPPAPEPETPEFQPAPPAGDPEPEPDEPGPEAPATPPVAHEPETPAPPAPVDPPAPDPGPAEDENAPVAEPEPGGPSNGEPKLTPDDQGGVPEEGASEGDGPENQPGKGIGNGGKDNPGNGVGNGGKENPGKGVGNDGKENPGKDSNP